ncbi:hypothetical protein Q9R19_07475 [Microbacterium sp. ARD32]|uniref:hypothetical protein n=1 Tax=Microbacterium sp. ARD32 TaxID=2962577 RepID=UPI002880F499|nr:hypothetical protein [Microbacterium sp. ARD32]MDT0157459.1 hypothetical protein [Microbacterium sp. ARD32]
MTAATLHLASPTRFERLLLKVVDALTAYIAHRREQRTQRREIALDLLREQQARRHDPRALDVALLSLGSRPRR